MTTDQQETVICIIRNRIKPGMSERYENWLQEIRQAVKLFPGFLGVNVIRPANESEEYVVSIHFDSHDNLTHWIESDQRKSHLRKIEDVIESKRLAEVSSLSYWPALEDIKSKKAKRWKHFLLVWSVIYPLTIIVPSILFPLLQRYNLAEPVYIRNLFTTVIIVFLMVYLIMPRYTKLVGNWLFK